MNNQSTDIAVMAREALEAATNPDAIKPIIDKHVQAAVETAVREATRSYSPFAKDLEERVKEALKLEDLDLPSYGVMICGLVENLVTNHVTEMVNGKLKQDLADLLSIAPKTIKLSEICKWMTDPKEGKEYGPVVTCHVEPQANEDGIFGPKWKIYLDENDHHDHRVAEKMADIVIHVSHGIKEDRSADSDGLNTGKIWHMTTSGGRAIAGKGFTTRRPYGLEQKLLALYAAETVIEIDEDECVTSVGDY